MGGNKKMLMSNTSIFLLLAQCGSNQYAAMSAGTKEKAEEHGRY